MHNYEQLQKMASDGIIEYPYGNTPNELYEPFNYILSLGGKRIRPVMVLMAYELFADQIEEALQPAIAIELFHNFTLIHDDIMDQASLRRGKPTIHTKYGVNKAILSGDVMLIYAYQLMCHVAKDMLPQVISIFNETAIKVCEGQQIDLNYENDDQVTLPQYFQMIELKTAVLLAASLQIGGIVANTDSANAKYLYEFGKNLGIAFQLQDDILDTFGDEEEFGKKVGGDILLNKKTYLLVKAINTAEGDALKSLNYWLSNTDYEPKEKITSVINIYKELGLQSEANTTMESYYQKAIASFDQVDAKVERKSVLSEFANNLMQRKV